MGSVSEKKERLGHKQASIHRVAVSLRTKVAAGPLSTTGSNSVPWILRRSISVAGAEPFPLTYISFWSVLSGVQVGLWGGRVHLARPRDRKPIFLGKGRLRNRSGLP